MITILSTLRSAPTGPLRFIVTNANSLSFGYKLIKSQPSPTANYATIRLQQHNLKRGSTPRDLTCSPKLLDETHC